MGFKATVRVLLLWLAGSAGVQALEPGDMAPGFIGQAANTGQSIRLGDYLGKVVFLDFWASWCPPCVASLPAYDQMRREIGTEGFEVIAVNVDENSEDGLRFLRQHPVSYPVLLDPAGTIGITYGLRTLPRSFIVDQAGRVVASYRNYREGDERLLMREIRRVMQAEE